MSRPGRLDTHGSIRLIARAATTIAAAAALALSAGPAAVASSSPVKPSVLPSDRAATHAFLEATLAVKRAGIEGEGASHAAANAAADRIAGECPGVLAHAPRESGFLRSEPISDSPPPRERGEKARRAEQLTTLENELEGVLTTSAYEPLRAAFARYEAKVLPLHWSDPQIAEVIAAELRFVATVYEPAPLPDVCADARFWVQSGYARLSASTHAFEQRRSDAIGNIYASLITSRDAEPEALVKRYEGDADRALQRRISALAESSIGPMPQTQASVRRKLGLPVSEELEEKPIPKHVVGHGRAHNGTRFTVSVEKIPVRSCSRQVIVGYSGTSGGGQFSTSGTAGCLPDRGLRSHLHASCDDGLIRLEAFTAPAVRRVRLRLSNGRTVESRPTAISRRRGGPVGFYVQLLNGPRPIPVSLSELDGAGAVVRTLRVARVRHCAKEQEGDSTAAVLVRPALPGNGSATIIGSTEQSSKSRRLRLIALGFEAMIDTPLRPVIGDEAINEGSEAAEPLQPPTFPWGMSIACGTPDTALVYGQLKAPATTVLAVTAGRMTALQQVALPAKLQVDGVLAYVTLSGLPTTLLVEDATGATIATIDLAAFAREQTEYCEGYAEPTA
ncbi:MAG TPA: hypothetical protein VH025_06920 [Solirubrobacteraceae bacterium]|nr:hypothetical protein [Solirubrobacteraceae bacterium]